ncbi:MAG: hypothetical protein JWN52_2855 [Actinomycetia bacterium]|nr:hypothetical protein [Actinomycetes bacterium]
MLINSLLAALAAVALVVIAVFAFKKYGKHDDEPSGPTAGHAGAMLSSLFLLVFAIAVIVPWATADTARHDTYTEAQSLNEAYWAAGPLSVADRRMVRDGLTDYVRFVVGTEWSRMADGKLSDAGWQKLDALRFALRDMQANDDNTKAARDDVRERIREVYAARRQRSIDAGASLPTGLLIFTAFTGLIMIIFPFMAGARPRGMAMVPLVVMAVLLCVCIYTVFNINHTFAGALAVGPDAFTSVLQGFARIP